MKVLDLQCAGLHIFEGWFASEEDFSMQRSGGQIQCPVCGDSEIAKRLSAPRLNLGATQPTAENGAHQSDALASESMATAQSQWLQVCKDILSNTIDVGVDFTNTARKIHYGEEPHRSIRGHATQEQVKTMLDEGIGVLPLVIPDFLVEPHH
jgi:hypothetical protein